MVRNMEKILKIESPNSVPKIKTETIEVIPNPFELDITNLESYTGPGIPVHIDLKLDQLEDPEK